MLKVFKSVTTFLSTTIEIQIMNIFCAYKLHKKWSIYRGYKIRIICNFGENLYWYLWLPSCLKLHKKKQIQFFQKLFM